MKRLFLSVAVLVAFASCSKDEVTDVAPSQLGSEVSFSTLNDRVTKSANDTGSNYQVFSVRSTADDSTDWYINETVSNLDVIISGKKYYWPVDGTTLAFYAYAPYNTGTTTLTSAVVPADATIADATISLAYEVNTTASEDFTIAAPLASGDVIDNDVPLVFTHMLSKVNIFVELSDALETAGYVLVDDAYIAANTTYEDGGAIEATVKPYTINFAVNASTGIADVVNQSLITYDGTTYDNGTKTSADGNVLDPIKAAKYEDATSYMIMPQDAEGCTIQIDDLYLVAYDVVAEIEQNDGTMASNPNYQKYILQDTENTLAEYTITGIDVTDNSFMGGVQYNITIVVDGTASDDEIDPEPLIDPIAFYSTMVEWADEDANENASENIKIYLYNEASYEDVLVDAVVSTGADQTFTVAEYKKGFEIYAVDEANGGTGTALANTTATDDIYSLIAGVAKLTVIEDGVDVTSSTSYTAANTSGQIVTVTQKVSKYYYNYYDTTAGKDDLYVIYVYEVNETLL